MPIPLIFSCDESTELTLQFVVFDISKALALVIRECCWPTDDLFGIPGLVGVFTFVGVDESLDTGEPAGLAYAILQSVMTV